MDKRIITKIASSHKCRRGLDVETELERILSLVASAQLLIIIKKEVGRLGLKGVSVVDGSHCDNDGYLAVIRSASKIDSSVPRSIRGRVGKSLQVDRIAENMLGLKIKGQ